MFTSAKLLGNLVLCLSDQPLKSEILTVMIWSPLNEVIFIIQWINSDVINILHPSELRSDVLKLTT